MVASIVTVILHAALPIIGWIFRREEKKQQIRDIMFRLIDEHCNTILVNNALRKEYFKMIQEKDDPPAKEDDKKGTHGIS